MKPTIEARMNRQIENARTYNTLFDVVVAAAEESLSITAENPADNQFTLVTESFTTNIICNDNEWNTISVYIDISTPEGETRIANLQINAQGGIEEDYHNIPRTIRSLVFGLVDDIIEAIEEYIDSEE